MCLSLHLYTTKNDTLCVLFLSAWQQHDIQELCRVMFDALEQKWKQTEQVGESKRLFFFFPNTSDNEKPNSQTEPPPPPPSTMETKGLLWEK